MSDERGRIDVWLIGRFEQTDATALVDDIESAWPDAHFQAFISPAAALADRGTSPDLIVVVQSRTQEYAPHHMEMLVADEPLAELIVAMGDWSASALRSERTWPESVAMPMWSAASRLGRLFAVLDEERPRLPVTAARDEAVVFDFEMPTMIGRPFAVAVRSSDRHFREMIEETCRVLGVGPLESDEAESASLVIWDVATHSVQRLASEAAEIRTLLPESRLVAAVATPTDSEAFRLQTCGFDALLPKPFSLAEFATMLRSQLKER